MGQSLAAIYVHLVFSTKSRKPFIQDPDIRDELHNYLGGLCNTHGATVVRVGGTEDHVHILYRQSRTEDLSNTIRRVKAVSSSWFKDRSGSEEFAWQAGYGAFSVGIREIDAVVKYINSQEEHHRKVSFQDEFRRLLDEFKIAYDEKYVWD